MKALEKLVSKAARVLSYLSAFLVLGAAAITVLEVFMRSVLNTPLYGANDVILMLLTIAVVGFFPLMIDSGHHMKIDVVGQRLGPKANAFLERFAGLVTLIVLVGFATQFWKRGDQLASYNEATQILQLPTAPVWWLAAAIMGFAAFCQLLVTIFGRTHGSLDEEHM